MVQHQQCDVTIKSDISKILGMFWNCSSDNLFYSANLQDCTPVDNSSTHKHNTKRSVLSVIARLYDPLGLINPILVTAKIILQKLWSLRLDWDDPIPDHLEIIWQKFIEDLQNINNIAIPRRIITIEAPQYLEIHAFGDASQIAYGACIYIRAVNNEQVSMRLLCSKSRIAPVKSVALPRLELCAAVLLARLLHNVKQSLHINYYKTICWTDSTIVLSWINSAPNTLETFVGNRVTQIQEITNVTDWRHIPSKLNPADILSRGCRAEEIQKNGLWTCGPPFLEHIDCEWPINPIKQVVSLVNINPKQTQKSAEFKR